MRAGAQRLINLRQDDVRQEIDRYDPSFGVTPTRPRIDKNPLDRKEYLLHVLRRI